MRFDYGTNGQINMPRFFQTNYDKFQIESPSNRFNTDFRECQLGAYWALLAHFTCGEEPALVSLPTGAGKTALMMALCFGLKIERALIICPWEPLRTQLRKAFDTLEILKTIKALPSTIGGPDTFEVSTSLSDKAKWEELRKFDVVFATPKTASPSSLVTEPPKGLFDLVIIDEAHHEPAPSWRKLLDSFIESKLVLMTATPFRRDKRRIQAPLVYHYPMGRALKSSICVPIEYLKVDSAADSNATDKKLCVAVKQLRQKNTQAKQSKILVRTDSVKNAKDLVGLYEAEGIKLGLVVHSNETEHTKIFADLAANNLDGLVCVSMLTEGIDLPNLKLAVLHSPPKSLPLTIQLLGRICRASKGSNSAYLIAAPENVNGEMRELYRTDQTWSEVIPILAQQAIKNLGKQQKVRSTTDNSEVDVDLDSLEPFLVCDIFRVSQPPDFTTRHDFADTNVEICLWEVLNGEVLVIVTEQEECPIWAKNTSLIGALYDLHLFYFDRTNLLLFENSTNRRLAKAIRRTITKVAGCARLDAETLIKAMSPLKTGDYSVVGMFNVTEHGGFNPAYKTIVGRAVDNSVLPLEGRVFAPGHAFASIASTGETRGIALRKARLWSLQRATITAFVNWCKGLAKELSRPKPLPGLPSLEHLARIEKTPKGTLTELPLCIMLDEAYLSAATKVEVFDKNEVLVETHAHLPQLTTKTVDSINDVLRCEFGFKGSKNILNFKFSALDNEQWVEENSSGISFKFSMEFSPTRSFEGNATEYLTEYPPSIVLKNGSVLRGPDFLKASTFAITIPKTIEMLVASTQIFDWKTCDIALEAQKPKGGKLNVQEFALSKFKSFNKNTFIVNDDRSGEVSDFVVFDSNQKEVVFVHCKFAHRKDKKKPPVVGASLENALEVFSQAARSVEWAFSSDLTKRILERLGAPSALTKLEQGSKADFTKFCKTFHPSEWTYKIVVVQPGFSLKKLKGNTNILNLISNVHQWLARHNCSIEFWMQA